MGIVIGHLGTSTVTHRSTFSHIPGSQALAVWEDGKGRWQESMAGLGYARRHFTGPASLAQHQSYSIEMGCIRVAIGLSPQPKFCCTWDNWKELGYNN